MADPVYNVVQLDDGSITVDAPESAFPEKGYLTLYDKTGTAKGECGLLAAVACTCGLLTGTIPLRQLESLSVGN